MIPANGQKVDPINPDDICDLEETEDITEGRLSVVTEEELEKSPELSVMPKNFSRED